MNVRVSPFWDGPNEVKKISEQQEEPNRLSVIIMESLILAQDERWRRA